MNHLRNPALAAGVLCLSVLVSGCLSGPAPVPKVAVNLLTDADVTAQPGWSVGWVVEVFESVGDAQTAVLSTDAPAAWNPHFLKNSVSVELANGRKTTFLLVDLPADEANGTHSFHVTAAVGAEQATADASVQVTRPQANVVKNGTVIKMDYVGFLDDNRVFDTSMFAVANSSGLDKWPDFKNSSAVRTQADYHPLQFTLGNHQVIQGWDAMIPGMALGNGRALIIPPELAYGRFTNQTLNLTEYVPIYNQTSMSAFKPIYGTDPVEDAEYIEPTYGWTVQVVSVDNSSGAVVLKNLPASGGNYTPFGINTTVGNLSTAAGTFELRFAPLLNQTATDSLKDDGHVTAVNDTAFTIRWQTEHLQTLAPYTLYFLAYVRSVQG